MVELIVMMKGVLCTFKIENREIFMKAATTGDLMFKLGTPENMKKEILKSRNKIPQICLDFVNAWKPEDIEKVKNMTTDKEMIEDMKNDFKLEGHEIIGE